MAAVSESIVREYFEMHGFFVRQRRKYAARNRREDEEVDFQVINPRAEAATSPLPFELTSADLARLSSAVVVVKGWHTETFSSAVITHAPEIFRFLEPQVLQQAMRSFGPNTTPAKILVVPALPQDDEARAQSIELLRSKGVDAVIPFHTLLTDLIQGTEINRNYQKSDLLQIIRVLKNYDFFRDQQLDLFRGAKRRKKPAASPAGEDKEPAAAEATTGESEASEAPDAAVDEGGLLT